MHYIVTEYGVVNLFGKTLKERCKLMIGLAHPDDRPALEAGAFELYRLRL